MRRLVSSAESRAELLDLQGYLVLLIRDDLRNICYSVPT